MSRGRADGARVLVAHPSPDLYGSDWQLVETIHGLIETGHEVLGEAGRYWTSPDEVAALVVSAESDVEAQAVRGDESRERAALYDWDEVASGYEALARRLALEGAVRRRPSGRRTGKAGW